MQIMESKMQDIKQYELLINSSKTKEQLWNAIAKISIYYQQGLNTLYRRNSGIFYTGLDLADFICHSLIEYILHSEKDIQSLKFLEPCVGIGNFVFSYLKNIEKLNLDNSKINQLLENIYVCDIDNDALHIYKCILHKFTQLFFNITLPIAYWNKHIQNKLSFNISDTNGVYTSFEETFGYLNTKFDIIITNPPYKNLKANENTYSNKDEFEKDKQTYKAISDHVKKHFDYANEGVLNLYKIFVEDILCNYSKDNAIVSLLIPNTILTDKTCNKIRNLILSKNELVSIVEVNENNKNIDAQQSMVSILVNKSHQTSIINIENFETHERKQINYAKLSNLSMNNTLYAFSDSELQILNILNTFPKIKDINFIINRRGELDLTANKKYISNTETSYTLLRGRNVTLYDIRKEVISEYVKPEFLEITNKRQFVEKDRIICQQISNINCEKRLKFAFCPSNHILGNSCNFIAIEDNKYGLDIHALLGILNSNLLNWYFKLISSNNHINNYELDELPIPLFSSKLHEISDCVQKYLLHRNQETLLNIDYLVNEAYGIKNTDSRNKKITNPMDNDLSYIIPSIQTNTNIRNIDNLKDYLVHNNIQLTNIDLNLAEKIVEKYHKLNNNNVLNHTTFKLSNLDMEMIVNIPQGGNWQNISDDVIEKSERLKKIKQTGGRTTLYGRLDYKKPSYTITTYFNRPGNGTYVHPIHNRVISVREAARLQSFCDDYYFVGNKSDILKQVGNAVPPLLAFQIARQIKEKIGINRSIDLFCGAGGMTQGFKHAGYETILGIDFDKSACQTYKINNPEINTICGDLTDNTTKELIINIAKREKVELICGGPPCQGFSLAGKRFIDDPRNQLFKEYLYIVDNIKPKVFVFENVEGLLTFQQGKIYKEILQEFSKIGYNISARMLKASDFCVPQKRKRIIIIGIREDIFIRPDECYPSSIVLDDYNNSTENAISDLEKIECSDTAKYTEIRISPYVQMLKKEITFDEFLTKMKQLSINKKETQLSLFAA